MKKYLEDGETTRVWYSDAPYSICGFYSLCQILQSYKNEVHIVKLPEYVVRKTSVVSYRNWGEVPAEEFIQQDKIEVMEESENKYARALCIAGTQSA